MVRGVFEHLVQMLARQDKRMQVMEMLVIQADVVITRSAPVLIQQVLDVYRSGIHGCRRRRGRRTWNITFINSGLDAGIFLLKATVELRWHILGNIPGRGAPALILQSASTLCECTAGETASPGIEEMAGFVFSSAAVTHWSLSIALYVLLAAWHAGK